MNIFFQVFYALDATTVVAKSLE